MILKITFLLHMLQGYPYDLEEENRKSRPQDRKKHQSLTLKSTL
jgi:hypothetical protein